MPDMMHNLVTLDPANLDETMRQLVEQYALEDEMQAHVRRVIALLPRSSGLYVDEANAMLFEDLQLADKFSFDTENDALALFTHDPSALVDALIELAMYLSGFATMLGSEAGWVVEFTIGCWRPVRNRLKRLLEIPYDNHPRGVVGLPPSESEQYPERYPFRRLVTSYDFASFHQMVVLAARDDIAVYFPPETHSKVLAVYVYMRRTMHEVGQSLGLEDHQIFNSRLLDAIRRMEVLFTPSELPPPGMAASRHSRDETPPDRPNFKNLLGQDMASARLSAEDSPFASFIEELFADEDDSDFEV